MKCASNHERVSLDFLTGPWDPENRTKPTTQPVQTADTGQRGPCLPERRRRTQRARRLTSHRPGGCVHATGKGRPGHADWRRGGPGGWKRRRTRASWTTMAIPHRSLKPESQQQSRQNPQPSFTESDISRYRYPHSPSLVLFNDIKAYHFILII